MADGYWNGQHQQQQQQQQKLANPSAGLLKRPRNDYELPPSAVPSSHAMHNYLRDDGRGILQGLKDTKTIGSAYDRYLQDSQRTSLGSGEASSFSGAGLGRMAGQVAGLMSGFPARDSVAVGRSSGVGSDLGPRSRDMGYDGILPLDAPNGRGMSFDDRFPVDAPSGRGLPFESRRMIDDMPPPRGNHDTVPLPLDASNTLYVEGLPPNCTKREVAHIFRPFVGYKEVRLVSKESKHRGGDPLILCFVDFNNPACAATALSALQGYKMDEHDPDSAYLRLQFSRHPGPRSTSGPRGKR